MRLHIYSFHYLLRRRQTKSATAPRPLPRGILLLGWKVWKAVSNLLKVGWKRDILGMVNSFGDIERSYSPEVTCSFLMGKFYCYAIITF
jgi:hypothetical protein